MADIVPGNQTSEYKMTKLATVVGIIMVICGGLESVLTQLSPALNDAKWIGVVLMVLGTILKLGAIMGYQAARADVKQSALNADAMKGFQRPSTTP